MSTRWRTLALLLSALLCAAGLAAPIARADSTGDRFTAIAPTRVLDTRTGQGLPGGRAARVGAGGTVDLQLSGVAGIPADADAVVVNVTGVGSTAPTVITVYPTTSAGPPVASNLNLPAAATMANLVTVKLGDGGRVTLRNSAGSVDLLADVAGYYAAAATSTFTPVTPTRTLDTRIGLGAPKGPVGAGHYLDLQVTGIAGVPSTAQAVVVNVTATGATARTVVTAYPTPSSGIAVPTVSNLNVAAGQTIANLVSVKVGALGRVRLRNSAGSVHLIADVAGYFSTDPAGSTFTPLAPTRLLDSRLGVGEPGGTAAPLGPGGLLDLQLGGVAGVPSNATAAVFNLTAVHPSIGTHLQAYPTPTGGFTAPVVSNVNVAAGAVQPNLTTVAVGAGGRVRLRNAAGSTDVLADLAGYYSNASAPDPPPGPPTPPVAGVTVAAAMSDPTPVQGSTDAVQVTTTPGATVTAVTSFPAGPVAQTATSDGSGAASIPVDVGAAAAGTPVPVQVTVYDPTLAAGATASTAFSPTAITATASTTPLAGTAGADGPVYATAVVGNVLVIGGAFSTVGGQPRANLAALDATTGALLPWTADTNGPVHALGAVDGMIGVGGDFSTVGGQARSYLALLGTDGTLQPLSLHPDGAVLAVAGSGTTMLFGGEFMTVNGARLRHLAQADVSSGVLDTSWTPDPDGRITSVATWTAATLLVGGSYTHISGVSRASMALVSLAGSGAASSVSFSATGCPAFSIAASFQADRIVVGCAGGGNGGNRFQAFDHTGGTPKWVHLTDGNAQAVVIIGATVYCGGHFAYVDRLSRKHVAVAALGSGALSPWSVDMNSAFGVWAVAGSPSRLWVGGEFTLVQRQPILRVAGFPISG